MITYKNTSFALACLIDIMNSIEQRTEKYRGEISAVLSQDYLRTYSVDHQTSERIKLNTAYLTSMVQEAKDITKQCNAMFTAFEKDTSPKFDTSSTLEVCFNYLQFAGERFDVAYLEYLGQPLRAANDIRSMRELNRLFESFTSDRKELPFADSVPTVIAMNELQRRLNLLCDKIATQLPKTDIDIAVVSAASTVLDKFGLTNLINYASELKAEIDGEEFTPDHRASAFNFEFNSIR